MKLSLALSTMPVHVRAQKVVTPVGLGKGRINLVTNNSSPLSLTQIKEGLLKNTEGKITETKDRKYNPVGFARADMIKTPSSCFYLYLHSICLLKVCVS